MKLRYAFGVAIVSAFVSLLAAASDRQQGVWSKRGNFVQVNAACFQYYTCGPREAIIYAADTQIVSTPRKKVWGVCSAGGGDVSSCNHCLTSTPTEKCEWVLRRR